ncbi:MAG TPA: hypothetical protein VGE27_04370 [Gemmatimonas sp.]|uniref:hypothetical protein n=1 Tax=Gemmatimonas sp. TaxID=1962908 RepID=UPI002EDA0262
MSSVVPWYRRETGLVVTMAGFVPALLAIVVPITLRLPLLGLAGVLLAVGLVMIIQREMRRPSEPKS